MEQAAAPRISFKRHVRVELIPGGSVYLVSHRGTFTLSGRYGRAVATLLDGTRTLAEVRQALAWSPAKLEQVLGPLSKANLIGYRGPAPPPDAEAAAYWDLAGLDGDRVGPASVDILATGAVDVGRVEQVCRAQGLTTGDGSSDLTLVFCDDYLDQELEGIADRHRALGRPWLPAITSGAVHWIGPVFDPASGPCWTCLTSRLRERRQGESCLRRELGEDAAVRPPSASLPATREIGIQLAVLEAAKWLAGRREDVSGVLRTLDTTTLETQRHGVTSRPQCPSCGDPGLVAARTREPVTVRTRPKVAYSGNGHRPHTAEQVWERYGHLADPVVGVTGTIVRDPRAPAFLHSYLAGHNQALRSNRVEAARAGLRSRSGGKGATDLEAKVSALCEAVERYSGARFGDEAAVRDTYRGLGADAVHPNACQLFHPRQFAERKRWNATHMALHRVPDPFDKTAVSEWTPVWSLSAERHRFLPTDLLYYGTGWADSNGNAAGSTLEDAIVQGFLELVERDAVALWWYNRTRHPSVALTTFDDAWITDLREQYGRLHRRLWVLDLTTDLGIPVMAAISRRVSGAAEDIMLGFGAHFDPHVAIRRALTELGQLLPAVATVKADGTGYGSADPHLLSWWRTATVAGHPYLLPDPTRPSRGRPGYGYVPRADLLDDLHHIRALVDELGSELLVLDQTRPDLGLPVVKVIVPGLRHHWARFGEGRLYDVPVRLGRLERRTPYEELNPIPLFV